MPRNFGEGRHCRCGKPLTPHQQKYCCINCSARYSKKYYHLVAREMPSDDEVWRQRNSMSWAELARSHDIAAVTLGNKLRARGWKKKGFGLTHAPCSECGKTFELNGQTRRLCRACERPRTMTPIQSLVERELARRRPGGDRFDLMWRTRRTYTFIPLRHKIAQRRAA